MSLPASPRAGVAQPASGAVENADVVLFDALLTLLAIVAGAIAALAGFGIGSLLTPDVAGDGQVTVTETAPPSGFVFGALRFTPGSGDDAALVSAANGEIVLDVAADEDGMIMLHVYNFAVAAAPQPTPAPTPAGAMPDTGVPANPGTSSNVALMGMLALMLAGSTGVLAAMSRRSRR